MDESAMDRRKLVGAALLIALIAAGGGALLRAASTTAAHGTTTKAEMLTQVGHLWDERDALQDQLAGKDAEIAALEAQLAALEQRVCELDPGSCDADEGDDEPLAGVVPGTGAVLFRDDFARANLERPAPIGGDGWQYTTPHRCSHCSPQGGPPETDPWVARQTDDGSPYVPIGQNAPNPVYLRSKAEPGVQSIYDAGVNNDATRSGFVKGYHFGPGRAITYIDFRQSGGFPFDIARGGGNLNYSQLAQFKDWKDNQTPSLYLGSNGVKLTFGSTVQQLIPAPQGQWIRIALEANWGGRGMQLWGDLNQSGQMVKIGPYHDVPLPPTPYYSIGLYHQMEHFTEPVHVDIANPVVTTMTG